jgi:hypothetical protein
MVGVKRFRSTATILRDPPLHADDPEQDHTHC